MFCLPFECGRQRRSGCFGPNAGNLNFNTGVEDLPDQPQDLTGELVPPDDGFGTPGDGTFNTPSLIEAADTGLFFTTTRLKPLRARLPFTTATHSMIHRRVSFCSRRPAAASR